MKRQWQLIVLSGSFLLGVVLAANFALPIYVYVYSALLVLSVLALRYVRSNIGYVLFLVIGLVLGMWRYDWYLQSKLPSALTYQDKKVMAVGRIQGEPRWDEYRNYVFYMNDVVINGQKVDGLVRVKTLTGVTREGQVVRVTGKLKSSQGKAESLISYAQVEIVNAHQPIMVQAKEQFVQGLNTTLPTESAAFMTGILIGERSALPANIQNSLTLLGLSHIVAVSGYNLTILVGVLQRRFAKNWRWGGLVGALWVILGFVVIAGASASIVRAGIMSALFLLANYYGKRVSLPMAIGLVAMMMVALQPNSILADIGWQLSFLSLFGIVLLAPKISKIMPKKPLLLNDILSVTLAAQIATLGFSVYKFGQLSLIAPLSNLLIMPLIPFLMLLGGLSAMLGILLPSLAYSLFGQILHHLLVWLFDLLIYLSSLHYANITVTKPSLVLVGLYYAVIVGVVCIVRGHQSNDNSSKYDKITGIQQPQAAQKLSIKKV